MNCAEDPRRPPLGGFKPPAIVRSGDDSTVGSETYCFIRPRTLLGSGRKPSCASEDKPSGKKEEEKVRKEIKLYVLHLLRWNSTPRGIELHKTPESFFSTDQAIHQVMVPQVNMPHLTDVISFQTILIIFPVQTRNRPNATKARVSLL